MPPKVRYTREGVLGAALEVVRRDGLRAVSARSVAKVLGASTAPVSACFGSMQELNEAVVAKLIDRLINLIETTEGPDPLRAAAYAMARFTADAPTFYGALFLERHPTQPDWVRLRRGFSSRLDRSPRFQRLDERQRDALAWRAGVVAHGICIEIWSGRWDRADDDGLWRLVDQLVEPVIAAYVDAC